MLRYMVAASFVLVSLWVRVSLPQAGIEFTVYSRMTLNIWSDFLQFLWTGINRNGCRPPYQVYIVLGIKIRCSTNGTTFPTSESSIFKSKHIKVTIPTYLEYKIQHQLCLWAAHLSRWKCDEANTCLWMASWVGKQMHIPTLFSAVTASQLICKK